jgi:hypothetical protein
LEERESAPPAVGPGDDATVLEKLSSEVAGHVIVGGGVAANGGGVAEDVQWCEMPEQEGGEADEDSGVEDGVGRDVE